MKPRLTLTGEQEMTLAREPIETSHPEAPENTASSEFTQMFGALQPTVRSDAPFAQPSQPGGLTDIFAAQPKPAAAMDRQKVEAPAEPAAQHPVPLSEAPTQSFAAIPSTPAVQGTASSNDETVIFRPAGALQPPVPPAPISSSAVPVSASVSAPQPASHQAANPAQPASDFTQVFTPLSPPRVPPPAPSASRSPEASGEFTQFFSAISARQGNAAAPQPKAPPAQVAPPPLSSPAPPAAVPTPPREPDVFSQHFREAQISGAVQPGPTAPSPHPSTPLSAQEVSEFTQLFSKGAAPGPVAVEAPVAMPSAPSGPLPDAIFGSPAPRGSLTDVFAAQPPAPAPSASAFTEIFRSTPASNAPSQPVPPPQVPVMNAFAPPVPSAPQAGGGEFTKLMQQLERPASESVPAAAAAALPVNAAWFNPPAPTSAGESEYTRVMRGGAASPAPGTAGGFPGAAAAVGFSQAPAKPADKDQPVADKQKPKTWIILLVAANVVLLVALIVLGVLLLRHK